MCAFRLRPPRAVVVAPRGPSMLGVAMVAGSSARASNAREDLSTVKQLLARSDQENAHFRTQIQELKNQLFQREHKITDLEEKLRQKDSRIEELRIENAKHHSLQTSLESEKLSNRASMDERANVLADLRARIKVLEAEKAALAVSGDFSPRSNASRISGSSTLPSSVDSLERDVRGARVEGPESSRQVILDFVRRAETILRFTEMLSQAIDDHAQLDELVPYVAGIKKQASNIRIA